MRTVEELMNVDFNDMTNEEKELAVNAIALACVSPVYDLSVENDELAITLNEKKTKAEFRKIKKLFKF